MGLYKTTKLVHAQLGSFGFNTNEPLTQDLAEKLAEDFDFCIRNISLPDEKNLGDLTADEAKDIIDSKLGLTILQHVRAPKWQPDDTLMNEDNKLEFLGKSYGQSAAKTAQELGLKHGMVVWLNLSNIDVTNTSPKSIIKYCESWYKEVFEAKFTPGLYVGDHCGLDSEHLFDYLSFKHYWRGIGYSIPNIKRKGYQMRQFPAEDVKVTINNITSYHLIQRNLTMPDYLEDSVIYMDFDDNIPPSST